MIIFVSKDNKHTSSSRIAAEVVCEEEEDGMCDLKQRQNRINDLRQQTRERVGEQRVENSNQIANPSCNTGTPTVATSGQKQSSSPLHRMRMRNDGVDQHRNKLAAKTFLQCEFVQKPFEDNEPSSAW